MRYEESISYSLQSFRAVENMVQVVLKMAFDMA